MLPLSWLSVPPLVLLAVIIGQLNRPEELRPWALAGLVLSGADIVLILALVLSLRWHGNKPAFTVLLTTYELIFASGATALGATGTNLIVPHAGARSAWWWCALAAIIVFFVRTLILVVLILFGLCGLFGFVGVLCGHGGRRRPLDVEARTVVLPPKPSRYISAPPAGYSKDELAGLPSNELEPSSPTQTTGHRTPGGEDHSHAELAHAVDLPEAEFDSPQDVGHSLGELELIQDDTLKVTESTQAASKA